MRSRPSGWVPLGDISRPAVGAILISEDWAFYQHNGFDAQQIKESLEKNLREGRYARGASTITQQVVRNIYLEREKNLWRKLRELFLALRLEKELKKGRILEIYLNIAEWGEGIYGVRAAARHYFAKSPSELSAKEGAFLAMLLPNPQKYSVSFRKRRLTRYATRTIGSILRKMAQAGYLTWPDAEFEIGMPLSFEIPAEPVEPLDEGEEGLDEEAMGRAEGGRA